ncbi:MAG: RNA polymerase sigma factor [Croceivirga sp.]
MDLETLIQNFQKKDTAAFQQLNKMYAENICGVINGILKNPERSEEVCQDVFIKIWNNAKSYNPSKGRIFTWILKIARNAAIDELRSKSHKNWKKNLYTDNFVGNFEGADHNDSKVDSIGIERLLKGLKQKCIQLIDLLYFKGFTQKEAAEQLDIPIGTVKTRNRSCISQLRENMKN